MKLKELEGRRKYDLRIQKKLADARNKKGMDNLSKSPEIEINNEKCEILIANERRDIPKNVTMSSTFKAYLFIDNSKSDDESPSKFIKTILKYSIS